MHEGFSNIYIIKLVSCFETKFARALLHPAMMWHGAWMVQGARGVCVWNDLFHSPVPKQHTHTIRNSKNLPHTARMHAYPIFLARVLWFIFLYINNKLMCECGQRMAVGAVRKTSLQVKLWYLSSHALLLPISRLVDSLFIFRLCVSALATPVAVFEQIWTLR